MNETVLKFLPLVKLVAKFSQSLSISAFCLYEKTQCKHFEVEFFSNELLNFWLSIRLWLFGVQGSFLQNFIEKWWFKVQAKSNFQFPLIFSFSLFEETRITIERTRFESPAKIQIWIIIFANNRMLIPTRVIIGVGRLETSACSFMIIRQRKYI